jgi:hypothetical protein
LPPASRLPLTLALRMTPPPKLPKNLYRIVGFERAIQLLESDELYLSHPSVWDDPYDRGPTHKKAVDVFAQCWCRKSVSDAMWRIYSPVSLGVRIGTTFELLNSAMVAAARDEGIKFKIQNVKYVHPSELQPELDRLKAKYSSKPSFETTIAPLFVKRNAFDHEAETRVVIHYPSKTAPIDRKGTSIKVDASKLIRSIWIDPRAPKAHVEAYKFYLEKKLKYKGVVKQSSLYAADDPNGR